MAERIAGQPRKAASSALADHAQLTQGLNAQVRFGKHFLEPIVSPSSSLSRLASSASMPPSLSRH